MHNMYIHFHIIAMKAAHVLSTCICALLPLQCLGSCVCVCVCVCARVWVGGCARACVCGCVYVCICAFAIMKGCKQPQNAHEDGLILTVNYWTGRKEDHGKTVWVLMYRMHNMSLY